MNKWFDRNQLHFAAQDGNVARIRELLAKGLPVGAFDELGKAPLHYEVEREHEEAVFFLIQSIANVNAHEERLIGNTPLREVAGNCSLRIARLFLEAGADPKIPGWWQLTALHKTKGRKDGDGKSVYELLKKAAESRSGS